MEAPPRRPLTSERDYADSAAAVLQKQRDRLLTILEALLQTGSWMRPQDKTPEELAILRHAQDFVEQSRRKTA